MPMFYRSSNLGGGGANNFNPAQARNLMLRKQIGSALNGRQMPQAQSPSQQPALTGAPIDIGVSAQYAKSKRGLLGSSLAGAVKSAALGAVGGALGGGLSTPSGPGVMAAADAAPAMGSSQIGSSLIPGGGVLAPEFGGGFHMGGITGTANPLEALASARGGGGGGGINGLLQSLLKGSLTGGF